MGFRHKVTVVACQAGLALLAFLLYLAGPTLAAGLPLASQGGTATTLTIVPNPGHVGETITFTAKVLASVSGTGGTPTGTVIFNNGATQLGMATIDANGIGIYTTSSLPVGLYPITATYSGDANFLGSTSPVVFLNIIPMGQQLATTTTLTIAPNPAQVGQTVTFTARVNGGTGVLGDVTGSITFYNGTTAMAVVPVDHTGVATYTNSSLAVGSYSIAAAYSGDANYQPSTSPAEILNVYLMGQTTPSTTSLTISPDPAMMGSSITFTARVGGGTGILGQATGTVTFYNGSNQIATETLDQTDTATYTSSSFDVGTYSITASYSGDAKYQPSASSPVPLKVNPPGVLAPTTTTLTSSAPQVEFGTSVTFFVTVGGGLGGNYPTGTVTFLDGSTTLSTAQLTFGSANYSLDSLSPGTHAMTAQYSGDANFAGSTSDVLNQVITYTSNSPTFLLEATPSTLTVSQGSSGTVTVTVTTAGGFNGQISFSCSGLPIYTTCSFSPATVNPNGQDSQFTSTLTVTTNVGSSWLRPGSLPFGRSLPTELATVLSTILFGVCGIGAARHRNTPGTRRMTRTGLFLAGICVLMSVWFVACGGSGATKRNTPTGSSTVTVAASSPSMGKTTTFNLTVQ